MNLGSLKYAPGSTRTNKRVGRGQASGTGQTAGRGHKGQHSRSGSKRRAWFEGGQMPLQRRLPKYGFYQHGKVYYQIVNVEDLNQLKDAENVTPEVLSQAGLIKDPKGPVKLLGNGKLEAKINISIHASSKSAREQVEKLGGTVTLL